MPRSPKKEKAPKKNTFEKEILPEPKAPEPPAPPAPEWEVDLDKLLHKMAIIKTRGIIGGLPNFANHIVVDCVRRNGKTLTVEEASALISKKINN